jgi:hypothetical protein
MIPVIVIVIVQELEFDDVEFVEALASIVGGLSPLAGSAAPREEPPPKNRRIARTEAQKSTHSFQCRLQLSRSGCLQP